MKSRSLHATLLSLSAFLAFSDAREHRPYRSIALSPEQAIEEMELPDGYRLEVMVSEPHVEEPVLAVFDGNGRMYVAEMRSYMRDVDATGEMEPTSRVSLHEDTNGDGNFDRHTVFADNLLLPRIILPLDERIIIGETNTNDLYAYRDTDGDGVADEEKIWYEGGPRGGNLEHQPNGLIWALDNGLYTTVNPYRLRFTNGVVEEEEITGNGGQWGLTQDDFGKVWFTHAGQEVGPTHFQQHILYGQFFIDGEITADYKEVWPIDSIPDTQGGRFQLRDDNTLNHFTATCGQDIFRGDRLPEDIRGDLFFAEPVGRLIRRTKIAVEDGVTRLSNAYDRGEFIRTADPLFRPVNIVTAPDGTLYIVDMYRGIIQEGNWTGEGSYLRKQILEHNLDKEIGRGRIYRIAHEDFEPGPKPNMLNESPSQLIAHLSHPNGWWRDTAQKLIILKGDTSIVPRLAKLAKAAKDPRTRAHALWTLEGLGKIRKKHVRNALQDSDQNVIRMGIRLAEPLIREREPSDRLLTKVVENLKHAEPDIVIQTMLSLKRAGLPDAKALARATAESASSRGVYGINEQMWADNAEDPFLASVLGLNGLKSYREGAKFYNTLCFSCHGTDGNGIPSSEGKTIAPPLANSPRVLGSSDAAIRILLNGLQGPVNGTDYGAPMIPMSSYSDEELANVLTYIRNSFGNRSAAVQAKDIANARPRAAERKSFWTIDELETEIPLLGVPLMPIESRGEWRVSASHQNEDAPKAIDRDPTTGYVSQKTPYPGMWFQIELPRTSRIRGLLMDSTGTEEAFPPEFEIRASNDGHDWSALGFAGHGEPTSRIFFPEAIEAKYLRITITKKNGWQQWAIHNLEIYGSENPL